MNKIKNLQRECLLWEVDLVSGRLKNVAPTDHHKVMLGPIDELDLKSMTLVPYCFDFQSFEIFYSIEINAFEASRAVFHYRFLREKTKKMVSVPWEVRLNEGSGKNCEPFFIFSPGRCGSTLLCKLLSAMGAVAISEPDIYTQAVFFCLQELNSKSDISHVPSMLKLITDDLSKPLLSNDAKTIVLKMRAEANFFPEVLLSVCDTRPKTIFIIRNFCEWAESWIKVFRVSAIDCLEIYTQSLRCYEYLRKNSDCFLIKYEDLQMENKVLLDELAEFLSLKNSVDLSAVFEKDSQEGSHLQRANYQGSISSVNRESLRMLWKLKMPTELLELNNLSYLKC